VITWLWLIGAPIVLFIAVMAGIGCRSRSLHRDGATVAGMIAWWRMQRRPVPDLTRWRDDG
jgi:hypothetical protein